MIIRVPATSANLGPGYDCMGMAFELYNDFSFEKTDQMDQADEDSLMYKTVKYFCEKNNIDPPKLKIKVDSNVPMTRGLGSSATCIVAGLIFANIHSGLNLEKHKLLEYATKIEGHPDNVLPAFLGGLICACYDQELVYYKAEVSDKLKFSLLIPDFVMETKKARELVKPDLALNKAILNIARSNLVFQSIKIGDMDLLKKSGKDLIHEPYRKKLIKDYDLIKEFADKNDAVLFISGAGSSLLLIYDKDNKKIEDGFDNLKTESSWQFKNLKIANRGAFILKS